MNATQIKNHLSQVFEQDYQGYDCFIKNVIDTVFTGEDAFEALPVPEDYLTDENRERANDNGILQILKVGTIDAEEPIEVFDITLSDKKGLQYNRVGIQQFVRSSLFPFTNAFMLFHNKTTEGKDWRFSFAYKATTLAGMTPAKRYTYLFGKNHRARTASERFAKLADEEKTTQNLLNAFSVEALSKDFFDKYKEQYDIFCNFLYDHKSDTNYFGSEFAQWNDKYLRDYVKKMMGRITFIHFLQRKGWMNGDMEYMQNAFQRSPVQDDYLDKFLEPLFFGVLNTKPENRKQLFESEGWEMSLLDEWKDVPYLNGGLFERDDYDKPKSRFTAAMFKQLFDFYSSYNFTIDENDPDDAEVGVDPEMLGHIFENLLEDNKDKGAFYTPKEIVQYMSQESIAQYLKTHTEEALHPAIDELIKGKKVNDLLQDKVVASAVYSLLEEVKVCDPAIGSGAFPMGVLNELYHARLLLHSFTKPTQECSPSNVKREIIQNNIYGVDIEKGAIDIARLRFWLSIVVDSEQPEALPNFDYKFMQGNSLLEEFGGIDLSSLQNQVMQTTVYEPQRDLFGNVEDNQMKMTFTQKETVDNLQSNLEKYFDIDDHTQKQAVKEEISNSVKDHISYNIELRRDQCLCLIQEANEAISDEESQIEDIKTRFPEDKMPVGEIRKHEKKISDLIRRVIDKNNKIVHHYDLVSHELEAIDLTSNESFFLWHTWFKDVFDNGGFDVVIGNPPYIQLQSNGGELAKLYENKGFMSFAKTGDIYCLFYEFGNRLLKQGGHLCFITSNKWMRAGYGEKLRDYFAKNVNPIVLVDFAGVKVFESATVDTNILIFEKGKNKGQTMSCIATSLTKNGLVNLSDFVRQKSAELNFDSSNSWVILSPIEQSIKEKIEAVGTPLKDWDVNIYRGVLTGFNDAFIISGEKRNEILNNCINEDERKRTDELIRPILRGRDIKRYSYDYVDLYLIATFPSKHYDIEDYPAVKNYLLSFGIERLEQTGKEYIINGERIKARKKTNNKWFETQDSISYWDEFNKPKIVWGNLNLSATFSLAPAGMMINAPATMIVPADESLLCVLNSKLADYYIRNLGVTRNGGYFEYKPMFIEQLPVPNNLDTELFFGFFGEESNHEKEIDKIVYELYGLTEEEIGYIEQLC